MTDLRQIVPDILSVASAQQLAELFSVLVDPNQLRLLSALTEHELCVCALVAIVDMSESAVSHQL